MLNSGVSLADLIYCGRKLRDDQTLDFYGIQSGSTVHVLRKSWPEPDQKPGEELWDGPGMCFMRNSFSRDSLWEVFRNEPPCLATAPFSRQHLGVEFAADRGVKE